MSGGGGGALRVRRALISTSDKRGVEDFARALHRLGVELVSTGGTARLIAAAGIPVREVSDLTGFPEIMDGRVKTLHPRVHGGLLGRRGTDDAVMREHGIEPIDLLAVNLYPFERTVAEPRCRFADAVENIDIGGPAMLRAAAKNHAAVVVVVDAGDYPRVLRELDEGGGAVAAGTRRELAAKAFAHTAGYDGAIANYLGSVTDPDADPVARLAFPPVYTRQFAARTDLRYGENPHQAAAFYRGREAAEAGAGPRARPAVARARLAQGKPLSFNNIADADAALECVHALGGERPACVIVKHANPCGAAVADTAAGAYEGAYRTDPVSAFGGIVAFNRPLDGALARTIVERQFVEVVAAPALAPEAEEALAGKPDVRVLVTGADGGGGADLPEAEDSGRPAGPADEERLVLRSVGGGGLLVQERDGEPAAERDLRIVTRRAPEPAELADLRFAWRIARFVKSNAIVYARGGATLGIGAGQTSRVHSARIARIKAEEEGLELRGAVMASDAFFPFRDGIDTAAEAGIAAVIQPGGSVRDPEVIAAADEHAMAMAFTGVRHFLH